MVASKTPLPAGARPLAPDGSGGDDVDARAKDVRDQNLSAGDRERRPQLGDLGKDGEDHVPRDGGAEPHRDHGGRPSLGGDGSGQVAPGAEDLLRRELDPLLAHMTADVESLLLPGRLDLAADRAEDAGQAVDG